MSIDYVDVANDVIDLHYLNMHLHKLELIEKHANAMDITNLIDITLTNVQYVCYIFG